MSKNLELMKKLADTYDMTSFYDDEYDSYGYWCYAYAIPEVDSTMRILYQASKYRPARYFGYLGAVNSVRVIYDDPLDKKGRRFYRFLCPRTWYPRNPFDGWDLRGNY